MEGLDGHLVIVSYTVFDALVDRSVIGHHETVPSPLITEHVGHKPAVHTGRDVIDDIEGTHKAACTGIGGRLVSDHIFIEHPLTAHIDGIVVASGLGGAVECEMLHAGHYLVITDELLSRAALISVNHGFGYAGIQVRVLAAAFTRAAPSCVTAQVHHRAESPGNAVGTGLDSRDMGRLLNCSHIPGAGETERNRENRLITVYYVHTEDHRYAKTRGIHGNLLEAAYLSSPFHVEKAADLAVFDTVFDIETYTFTGSDGTGDWQVELADLLLEGHPAHKGRDETVHLRIAGCALRAGRCAYCQRQKR